MHAVNSPEALRAIPAQKMLRNTCVCVYVYLGESVERQKQRGLYACKRCVRFLTSPRFRDGVKWGLSRGREGAGGWRGELDLSLMLLNCRGDWFEGDIEVWMIFFE